MEIAGPLVPAPAVRVWNSADGKSGQRISKSERLPFIRFYRSVAIILVVLCHCGDLFLPADVAHAPWLGALTRHVNLLFTFISGFLFQFLLPRYSYGPYLGKKISNVLVPYVIISIPAILIYIAGFKSITHLGVPDLAGQPITLALYMIVTGAALSPLWFIPMITILFLLAPLWRFFDLHPRAYWLILPWLAVSLAIGRSGGDVNPIQNALYYAPIYLIGMAAAHSRDEVLPLLARYWPPLVVSVLLPLTIEGHGLFTEGAMLLSKILMALGVVGFLFRHSNKLPRQLGMIGDMSFGIYFVHYYLIGAATALIAAGFLPHPHGILMLGASVVVITAASAALVAVIARLSGRMSRLVIGF